MKNAFLILLIILSPLLLKAQTTKFVAPGGIIAGDTTKDVLLMVSAHQ